MTKIRHPVRDSSFSRFALLEDLVMQARPAENDRPKLRGGLEIKHRLSARKAIALSL